MMTLDRLRGVLTTVLDRVAADGPVPEFRLVGTAAALLQGVPLAAGDVDVLLAERAAVDRFAAGAEWLPEARQYFARIDVAGVDVEFSTVEWPVADDVHECAGPGPWRHHALIPVGGHLVPAVRLELRLVTELVRNRPDRYRPLLAHLRRHGADAALLEAAMIAREVDPELRCLVTDSLP